MDLVSNDKILEVTNDTQKEEGSDFVEKLDLNVVASKEEEGNGTYSHGNAAWNDASHEMEMDLNQQEPQGSPLLPAYGSSRGSESLQMKPSSLSQSESLDAECSHYAARKTDRPPSLIQSDFYQDDVENRNVGCALKRSPSPPKDNHPSGEPEAAYSGDYTGKSSCPLQMESCHDGRKAEDTLLSVVANTTNEKMMDTHVSHGEKTPYDGEMNKYSNRFLENPGLKMNSACESENYHHSTDQLLKAESEKENYQYSDKLPTENGEIEVGNLDPNSPGKSCERSPIKLNSPSPDISSFIPPSPEKQLSSPIKGVQESFHSPGSFRERHSRLPQGPTMDDVTRVDSHDCLSPAAKGKSTSPWRAAKNSQQRDPSPHNRLSVSPKKQHSPPGHRRQNRSASRSPIRRKVSPLGYGRDYRDRSRSRSPHARDRHSRPLRRRYSPSRRSPRGYPSRRSPRRRPWSPPPNRSTGVGRPGKNLFIAGFSFVTTERDLERKFSRFGRVTGVRIVRDKRTGDSRGFGFLSLERDEDADAAIRALDQTEWNGRIVLVEKSKTSAR